MPISIRGMWKNLSSKYMVAVIKVQIFKAPVIDNVLGRFVYILFRVVTLNLFFRHGAILI